MMSAPEARSVTPVKSLSVSYESFERTKGLIVKLGAIRSTVWPSAGARATSSAPITVLPPGRFSTMTLWPSVLLSGAASARPRMSTGPRGRERHDEADRLGRELLRRARAVAVKAGATAKHRQRYEHSLQR